MLQQRNILYLFISFFLWNSAPAQLCSNLGQNPSTAFPVCGTSTFSQQTVPACGGRPIPVPGCEFDNADYGDLNPFWYKFTCYSTGTLGFTITPLTNSDDYDWQLFDITGHQPDDVYTNRSLFVAGNWSANPGATGTNANASSFINCAGYRYPNKSKMPTIIKGHQYLLLVSHFTSNNQSGYKLNFAGGTANISDPKIPELSAARVYCDGVNIIIRLNKKMRCNTLAKDGSDFILSDANYSIREASSLNCNQGFDTDSIVVTLDKPLPPGNYFIAVKKGSDQNTLLDNCDREIAEGEKLFFTVETLQPTPMDSVLNPGCKPEIIQLFFKKPIRCNSVSPDGSDFILTGAPGIAIISASGQCNANNTSNYINIRLNKPVTQKGTFTIQLKKGNDGNSIIDECDQETPAGMSVSFHTKDTVSAKFDYTILYGCYSDTVIYTHNALHEVNQWSWIFDDSTASFGINTQKTYQVFGTKNTTLLVSNGVCSDTSSVDIFLENELKADFVMPEFVCPRDTVSFVDKSIGQITSWSWSLGDGRRSLIQSPTQQTYSPPVRNQELNIELVVTNQLGCSDTLNKKMMLISNCFIDVPSAFSPNGDNLNDYLYPLNAYKARNLLFRVYNVYGQKLFEARKRGEKWDGTFKGKMQSGGTYIWTLEYIHTDTGQQFRSKGTTLLIR